MSGQAFRVVAGAVACAAALATSAQAQTFPTRTVTVVVPFAAGGPTDTLARSLAQAMGTQLKQTVVIENVGGAGGTIGVARIAKASHDGYNLLLHHIGMSTAPFLYRTLPFKVTEDFAPIGLVADVPMTLIARSNFPPASFKELLPYLKANKDKVTYANAGLGAASHLCGMLFMSAIQAEFITVPYKGTGPAMNDLLGGQVDLMCDQTTNTTNQIKSGKVKVYGVTTKARVPALKDVPTLDEQGLKSFEVEVWHGLYAPKGTPQPVIDTLVRVLQIALTDPKLKTLLADLGTEPVAQNRATPAALASHLKAELEKWGALIKAAGVYAD